MAGFIEELYYGKISPQESSLYYKNDIEEQLRKIANKEKLLTDTFSETDKRAILDLINAYDHLLGVSSLDSFTVGFKIGA